MKNDNTLNMVKNNLSPLESIVLDVLIDKKKTNAKEIYRIIRKKHKIALTSICVMLDRLHQKGIVSRKAESCKGGFRYLYSAKKDKKDYEIAVIDDIIKKLTRKFGSTAIAYFNEKFGKK